MSKQLRSIGFDWRPGQKAEKVKGVIEHLRSHSSAFIRSAVSAQDKFITLVYTIVPSNDIASMDYKGEQLRYVQNGPQYWTALIMPEKKQMVLDAPSSVQQLQRDVLTGILDIAEEIGCDVVYSTVRMDNPDMSTSSRLTCIFLSLTHSPIHPSIHWYSPTPFTTQRI